MSRLPLPGLAPARRASLFRPPIGPLVGMAATGIEAMFSERRRPRAEPRREQALMSEIRRELREVAGMSA